MKNPGPAPALPDITAITIPPSKEAQELGKKVQQIGKRSNILLLTVGGAILGIGLFFGCSLWQLLLAGLGVWGVICIYNVKEKKLTGEIAQQLAVIKGQWKELSSNWATWATESAFTGVRLALDELKQKYDALLRERQAKLQKLWDNRRQQQLLSHLDRYRIVTANVDGIGPGRRATLQSYGIETAADIVAQRINGISGFGSKLIQRLLDWRNRCEQAFVFDSAKGVSQSDIQTVDRDLITKRSKIEQDLVSGIARLKRISDQTQERRKQLYSQASAMINTYAQIIANAREVGINP